MDKDGKEEVHSISKEEFEEILNEIGHLIESDKILQSTAYGVHWLGSPQNTG